jgi:hypothetical protein
MPCLSCGEEWCLQGTTWTPIGYPGKRREEEEKGTVAVLPLRGRRWKSAMAITQRGGRRRGSTPSIIAHFDKCLKAQIIRFLFSFLPLLILNELNLNCEILLHSRVTLEGNRHADRDDVSKGKTDRLHNGCWGQRGVLTLFVEATYQYK